MGGKIHISDKTIYHGGKKVGSWEMRIGEDIGIVKADYDCSNEFLDISVTATKLLHSTLLTYRQFIVID
jgi:hypothetical protein